MKKTIVIYALLALFACATASARTSVSAGERAKKLTRHMVKTLKLTNKQRMVVADINLNYSKKIDQVLREYKNNDMGKSLIIQTLLAERNGQLLQVLTFTQYVAYMQDASVKRMPSIKELTNIQTDEEIPPYIKF
jgi:hypothetical protein